MRTTAFCLNVNQALENEMKENHQLRMKFLALTLLAAVCALSTVPVAAGESSETYRLVYSETIGDKAWAKEYAIKDSVDGYEISITAGETRRVIHATLDLETVRETYLNTETSDRVEVKRQGCDLLFKGRIGDDTIDSTKNLKDEIWFGSVLLLRDFVLSDAKESIFYMTKPEEEKAIMLKAIRQEIEFVEVNGQRVEAVKIKFTLPDMRSIFWKSYYWFRLEDGLLVKTDETRGPPGAPKARVELTGEQACEECAWRRAAAKSTSVAER